MKKKFFKPFILFAAITIPSCFNLTSCTIQINTYVPINDDHFKYISEREMSIGAYAITAITEQGQAYASFGTAWFYKRYSDNDYTYEIITNYHVYEGIKGILNRSNTTHQLGFASNVYDPYSYKKIEFYNDYAINESTTANNFTTLTPAFVSFGEVQIGDISLPAYMDICAFKVDLTNAYNNSRSNSTFKDQIDYINSHYLKGANIVNINEHALSSKSKVYMAGFPWANSSPGSDCNYTYFCEEIDYLDKLEQQAVNIVSPTYLTYQNQWTTKWKSLTYMGGGASGSMVINEDYEVVGIYWGGSGYEESSEFQKTFALFSIPGGSTEYADFFATAASILG